MDGRLVSADLDQLPAHLRRIAYLMDESIRLPGGYRIGWDPIIGLIPGIGDALATMTSMYIVAAAVRAGVRRRSVFRMIMNVALEFTVGLIPVVGDIFDGIYKSNLRNLRLMNREMAGLTPDRRRSPTGTIVLVLAVLLLILALGVALILWLGSLIFGLLAG